MATKQAGKVKDLRILGRISEAAGILAGIAVLGGKKISKAAASASEGPTREAATKSTQVAAKDVYRTLISAVEERTPKPAAKSIRAGAKKRKKQTKQKKKKTSRSPKRKVAKKKSTRTKPGRKKKTTPKKRTKRKAAQKRKFKRRTSRKS